MCQINNNSISQLKYSLLFNISLILTSFFVWALFVSYVYATYKRIEYFKPYNNF